MSNSLEAKICVLGAQGVGKTSLVTRYVKGTFDPPNTHSTIGASFLTKRVIDIDTGTTVRLQVWDTAGQERFRSISKLYYRGASAVILVYSILDDQSFVEMGVWLQEIKKNLADDVIVHVVGTKSDVVAADPSLRRVPFERCIAYVAQHFPPALASTPPLTAGGPSYGLAQSGDSKRSSGFWGQDAGWDICHEISASSGEGIEEVFRVITRKLVEQKLKRVEHHLAIENRTTPATDGAQTGYFDRRGDGGTGSFRIGIGDKRRSWLGFPTPNAGITEEQYTDDITIKRKANGRCC